LVENPKVVFSLGVPPSLDLLLVPDLLILPKGLLLLDLLLYLIILQLPQLGCILPRKPPPGQPLYVQSRLVPPLLPHLRIEVKTRPHKFVGPVVDEQALFLHLGADFPLDFGGFGDPFVGLRLAGIAEFVSGLLLVGLGEGIPAL